VASFVIRTLGELGDELSLAPERQRASELAGGGVALEDLVVLRNTRDGLVDLVSARRASAPPRSAKKRVRAGDLLVSRLRPYLRQIAFVHPRAVAACGGVPLGCSTEYYVLAPRDGQRLEYLLPFLLGPEAQAFLAAGQEGGHHPRVPLETLLALRVPVGVVRSRAPASVRVDASLAEVYRALGDFQRALGA